MKNTVNLSCKDFDIEQQCCCGNCHEDQNIGFDLFYKVCPCGLCNIKAMYCCKISTAIDSLDNEKVICLFHNLAEKKLKNKDEEKMQLMQKYLKENSKWKLLGKEEITAEIICVESKYVIYRLSVCSESDDFSACEKSKFVNLFRFIHPEPQLNQVWVRYEGFSLLDKDRSEVYICGILGNWLWIREKENAPSTIEKGQFLNLFYPKTTNV